MKSIPRKFKKSVNPISVSDLSLAISRISSALITLDTTAVGILRDDKKKLQMPSPETREQIQELLAEAYWIMELENG